MSKKKTPNKPMEDGKDSSFYSNVSRCIICLDEVRCRGKLSVCKHWFCYGCILEWSKNTNTCPVCKTRFRSISKVHLSPMKSPPTKVRVPDRDQRVWHDDADDGIPEELLYDIQNEMQEDMDDDYEPPGRLEYEDDLDEYDLEDSFIDDSSLSQASSHATPRLILTEDLDHATTTRDSPYMLRRRPGRSGPGTRGRDVTLDFYALDNIGEETELIDISSDASSDSSLTDSESDEELTERARATRPSTRRASQRTLSLRRTTRSQASRSTRSHAPRRSTRSHAPRRSTRSHAPTRSTRSQARLQEEQARNQKQRQDEMIAQNIQETGSSGWLSTRRANGGRAAAASTSRGQAQAANHDSSTYKTRGNTNESTHQHARDGYSSSCKKDLRRTIDHDDDTDDSDETEDDNEDNLPLKALVTRARADTQPRSKSSPSRSANNNGLSRSPRAQGTPRKQERKDPCSPRNRFLSLETSLPSTSHAIEDDSTSNLNEVKKWKRIKMGKSKGKENLSVSRTRRFFTQGASNMTLNDPDFNPILSDEIPSKRARQDTDNGGRGCKRQKSSRPRMACALERSLENNSNCRYSLRKREGTVDDRDDDDDDDDSDDEYSGKSMKSGATVTIMRQDTTDDDDDDNLKKHITTRSWSRGYDADDNIDMHKYTGKGKSYKASVRSHDFEDDEDYVGKGKTLSTSVKCASDKYKNDFTDDDSIYNHDEQSNIIVPTPQPDRQRSLFTRRQHRTICAQFDGPLNAEEQPLGGRPTQTQPQFPANTGKRESCGHRNESKASKVMASRKSGQQLIQCKECNDFTPELGSSNNHFNGSRWSNQTLVGRTRRRIKVYDSDSD